MRGKNLDTAAKVPIITVYGVLCPTVTYVQRHFRGYEGEAHSIKPRPRHQLANETTKQQWLRPV